MEVQRLNIAIKNAKKLETADVSELKRKLDEWTSVAADIEKRFPKIFTCLLDEINRDSDPEEQVNKLIRGYEMGEEEVKKLVREV